MPGNMIVINGAISYYVGDSKMDEVIALLDKVGLKQDINPEFIKHEAKYQKIKRCKCGASQRLKTKGPILQRMDVGSAYAVYCRSCGEYGPIANYEDEAIYNWNQIKNKKLR